MTDSPEKIVGAASVWGERAAAIALAALVLAFAAWALDQIGRGHLTHPDELAAGCRAREQLVRGDSTRLTQNFRPMVHKPPLVYLQGALTLRAAGERELTWAVRLPSALWATLALALVGVLGWQLSGRWSLGLLAAALSLCHVEFVLANARRGLLDSAQTALLLAVASVALAARRRPALWLLAGALVGLQGWHKFPLAWPLLLLLGWLPEARARRGWWWGGLALASLGALSWPLVQLAWHGDDFARFFMGLELPQLVHGSVNLTRHPRWIYARWIVEQWSWIGVAAPLAALGALLASRRAGRLEPEAAFALFGLAWLLALSAFGKQTARYAMPAIPLLALALACLPARLPSRARAAALAGLLALLAVSWGPAWRAAGDAPGYDAEAHAVATALAGDLPPDASLFAIGAARRPFLLLELQVHGRLDRLVSDLELDQPFAAAYLRGAPGPLRGTCPHELWPVLRRVRPDLRVRRRGRELVVWATR